MTSNSLWRAHPKRIDVLVLILISTGLLIQGLSLPILTTRQLWNSNTFSILSGVTALWKDHYVFLAAVIFFFSIVFPFVKLATLFVIWVVPLPERIRRNTLHFLSLLGKWSMLDVFVSALVIVAVRLGALASAKVEVGLYFFAASVLLAMVATGFENHLAAGE